jgi:hypothetical protein
MARGDRCSSINGRRCRVNRAPRQAPGYSDDPVARRQPALAGGTELWGRPQTAGPSSKQPQPPPSPRAPQIHPRVRQSAAEDRRRPKPGTVTERRDRAATRPQRRRQTEPPVTAPATLCPRPPPPDPPRAGAPPARAGKPQEPETTVETTVATQSTANARSRNGAKDDSVSAGFAIRPFIWPAPATSLDMSPWSIPATATIRPPRRPFASDP